MPDSMDDAIPEPPVLPTPEAAFAVAISPHASQIEVNTEMLIGLPAASWNELVFKIREEDPDWKPDFTNAILRYMNFGDFDLSGANFEGANLQGTTFRYARLMGANFTNTNLSGVDFYYANVTDADPKNGIDWQYANNLSTAIGFVPLPPDVTEDVARIMLRQMIDDPDSEVNDGLKALSDDGLRISWSNDRLTFWMAHEIEKRYSPCREGECDCETEHSCHGDCSCCPCYSGDCGCEPHHSNDSEPSGEWYLSTVIGYIQYNWSDRHGLYGHISMNESTMHPHVSHGGSICWGSADQPKSIRAADYLLTIMGWIGQHDPIDPYRDIEDLPKLR